MAQTLLDGFRDHLDSWCADVYFTEGRAPGPLRRAWLATQLLWLRLATPLVCAVLGHTLTDHDPGHPEVGPQPQVFCDRCGR